MSPDARRRPPVLIVVPLGGPVPAVAAWRAAVGRVLAEAARREGLAPLLELGDTDMRHEGQAAAGPDAVRQDVALVHAQLAGHATDGRLWILARGRGLELEAAQAEQVRVFRAARGLARVATVDAARAPGASSGCWEDWIPTMRRLGLLARWRELHDNPAINVAPPAERRLRPVDYESDADLRRYGDGYVGGEGAA